MYITTQLERKLKYLDTGTIVTSKKKNVVPAHYDISFKGGGRCKIRKMNVLFSALKKSDELSELISDARLCL